LSDILPFTIKTGQFILADLRKKLGQISVSAMTIICGLIILNAFLTAKSKSRGMIKILSTISENSCFAFSLPVVVIVDRAMGISG
jgi:hypothetical protein